MEKRNKMKTGCVVLFIIVVCCIVIIGIRIYKDTSELEEAFKAEENTTLVEFKDTGQTIFITVRKWGLLGQHSHTIISDKDFANNDELLLDTGKDIVLDEICGFYYKVQEPDSLLVYFSSGSYTDEEIIYQDVGDIKIKITKYKISMDRYYKNHKELGLSLIKCYGNNMSD